MREERIPHLDRIFLPFWAFFARLSAPRYNARIQFLIAQVRILRSRVDASRIVPTPEEKADLMRWGAMFDHRIDGVMEVVKPATYRTWLPRSFNPPLRPHSPQSAAISFAGRRDATHRSSTLKPVGLKSNAQAMEKKLPFRMIGLGQG